MRDFGNFHRPASPAASLPQYTLRTHSPGVDAALYKDRATPASKPSGIAGHYAPIHRRAKPAPSMSILEKRADLRLRHMLHRPAVQFSARIVPSFPETLQDTGSWRF